MALENQDIELFAQDTMTHPVTVTDDLTGALIDFTDAEITWRLKRGDTTILTKTVGSGITITGSGTFTIALTEANTTGLSGEYQHEARAELADGRKAVVFTGTLRASPTIAG